MRCQFGKRWTEKAEVATVERLLTHKPSECLFVERCPRAMGKCRERRPPGLDVREGQSAACFLYGGR